MLIFFMCISNWSSKKHHFKNVFVSVDTVSSLMAQTRPSLSLRVRPQLWWLVCGYQHLLTGRQTRHLGMEETDLWGRLSWAFGKGRGSHRQQGTRAEEDWEPRWPRRRTIQPARLKQVLSVERGRVCTGDRKERTVPLKLWLESPAVKQQQQKHPRGWLSKECGALLSDRWGWIDRKRWL